MSFGSHGAQKLVEFTKVAFLDRAGIVGQLQGVGIGGNGDGAGFEQNLFGVSARKAGGAIAILPFQGHEADRDGVEKTAFVKCVGDLGQRVRVDGEVNALKEFSIAHLGDAGFADGAQDGGVIVRVLEHRVFQIGIEHPAGGADDFVVAIERFIGADEVDDRFAAGVFGDAGADVEAFAQAARAVAQVD